MEEAKETQNTNTDENVEIESPAETGNEETVKTEETAGNTETTATENSDENTAEAVENQETEDSTAAEDNDLSPDSESSEETAEAVESTQLEEADQQQEEAPQETVEVAATDSTDSAESTNDETEQADESSEEEEKQEEEVDEFTALMENYSLKEADTESQITGTIIDIIDNKVIVDIGQKTEGILNKEELYDWDGNIQYKVGDSITVVCKSINMKQGYITVSKRQVDASEGWQSVKHAYETKEPITGQLVTLMDDNKGFKVDMGVEMFLPMSQVDIRKVKSPKSLIGKKYEFRVTRLNSREKSGVVSRRVLLEEEREVKIKELFDSLNVGDLVKGVVTSLTDYGAFVNIGGMDGLIHKDNISYGRVNHPKEKLRKGDEVEAMVLEMDQKKTRISLGLKQKYPDPWVNIAEKYPVGKKLIAKVTKIVSFGAFIELEEGVEGLLHISDLSWEGKTNSVEEFVEVGEKLWVQVIELHPNEKKIKLGLKQLEMRPEEKYIQERKSGEIVSGVVKKILKSRVFVELDKNVEGVIKISDISYFRIDSPHEFLKEKETVDVMIISDSLDSNYKVKLGLKQLSDHEWKEYINAHRNGSLVTVKVKKVTENGMSVEISKNIEGFIRPNEFEDRKMEAEEALELYKPGQELEALILNSDFERKRIYLSLKAVKRKKEREEIDKYSKSDNEQVTTIGDLFQNALDKGK
jgi:small subunit ribosomal protein S1